MKEMKFSVRFSTPRFAARQVQNGAPRCRRALRVDTSLPYRYPANGNAPPAGVALGGQRTYDALVLHTWRAQYSAAGALTSRR